MKRQDDERRLGDYSENSVLDLIGSVYDAAADPSLWPTFLEKFADKVHGGATSLIWFDFSAFSGTLFYNVRLDPGYLQKYNEYYSSRDVWAEGTKQIVRPGLVFCGEEACPNEKLDRTEFCADFLQPINGYHVVGGVFAKSESSAGALTVLRPKKLGPFERESELLKLVLPHLRRAMQIHTRVLDLQGKLDAVTDALERWPHGVISVDRQGKVLLANRAAKRILDLSDGLSVSRQALTAALPSESARLRKLIHGAAMTSKGAGTDSGGMMLVSRPSLKRSFSLIVTPRPPSDANPWGHASAAMIFVSDPETKFESGDRRFGRLFGFTPAESKLALSLMEGKSLQQASEEFSVTRNTVRSQLQKIFEKTGTGRQVRARPPAVEHST